MKSTFGKGPLLLAMVEAAWLKEILELLRVKAAASGVAALVGLGMETALVTGGEELKNRQKLEKIKILAQAEFVAENCIATAASFAYCATGNRKGVGA